MKLSTAQKRTVVRVVNVFETGKADGDYAALAVFNDGPNDIRQITYGRSQTTEYGNLRELVAKYVAAKGIYSQKLKLHHSSKNNTSYLFPWKLQQILRAQKHCLIEKILSYKTLFFNVVTTIGCAFLPAVNVLQATFVAICVTGGDPLSLSPLLKHATHRLTMLTSTVCSPETFSKC